MNQEAIIEGFSKLAERIGAEKIIPIVIDDDA